MDRPFPDASDEALPGYFEHPAYQQMLKDVGLDPASLAKINVPPLSF